MRTGKYDGVHFYGPKGCEDYTLSVINILTLAQSSGNSFKPTNEFGTAQDPNHTECPQAKHQNNDRYQPSVVTKNRFSVLNQGNW